MNNKKALDCGIISILVFLLLLSGISFGQAKPAPKLPKAGIDLNKATAEQIGKIPGLNAALGKAIAEFRDKSGPYKKPEDLLNVKGMSKDIFNKIKPKMEKDMLIVIPPAASDDDEDEPSLKPSKC